MSITHDFIRNEIKKLTYEISLHADDERIADGLTVSQVENVLSQCEILEQYPNNPRGQSCLIKDLHLTAYQFMSFVVRILLGI